jgi:hypothetical protein
MHSQFETICEEKTNETNTIEIGDCEGMLGNGKYVELLKYMRRLQCYGF